MSRSYVLPLVAAGLAGGWVALTASGCGGDGTPSPQTPASPGASASASGAPNGPSPSVKKAIDPCTKREPKRLDHCVDGDRLKQDVARIAKPRPPGSPHWKAVREDALSALKRYGYKVEEDHYGSGINVLARLEGNKFPGEEVIVSAHYDHIPGCAGADDNATGVAATMEIARLLNTHKWPRTLVIALWDEEETGLKGSRAYARKARTEGRSIFGALVFDSVGYATNTPNSQQLPPGAGVIAPEVAHKIEDNQNRGDFLAVIGDPISRDATHAISHGAKRTGLPLIEVEISPLKSLMLNDVLRSDHASFWLRGYPAVFLTDTAEFRNKGYHCHGGPDTADTLDYGFLKKVTQAGSLAAVELLSRPPGHNEGNHLGLPLPPNVR